MRYDNRDFEIECTIAVTFRGKVRFQGAQLYLEDVSNLLHFKWEALAQLLASVYTMD